MVKNRVLVDSSVLISALLSDRGGSFYILRYLNDEFIFQINEYILEEVRLNLNEKFSTKPYLKTKLFSIMVVGKIVILPYPPKAELSSAGNLPNKKDAPILASALIHSDYLLTLDNDFLSESVLALADKQGLEILKPEDFIQRLE